MLKKIDGIEVGNTIEEEKIYISDLNKTDEFDGRNGQHQQAYE